MDAVSLPARIGYAVVALPAGEAVGFAANYWVYPALAKFLMGWPTNPDDGRFYVALGIGAGVGFTAFVIALTLPWRRRKRRSGRVRRSVFSGIFVVLASLAFAGLGHELIYDLLFAGWLAYLMAFTYVRHGVLDRAAQTVTPARLSSSVDPDD